MYPDFNFALYAPELYGASPSLSRAKIVESALGALSLSVAQMYASAQTDIVPISSHVYSRNTMRWHDRYMNAPVPTEARGSSISPLMRRKDIVSKDRACGEVIYELSAVNHPVFQLVSWLETQFGRQIARVDTADVTQDIVLITQLPLYRAEIDKQIARHSTRNVSTGKPKAPAGKKGRFLPFENAGKKTKPSETPAPKHRPKAAKSKGAATRVTTPKRTKRRASNITSIMTFAAARKSAPAGSMRRRPYRIAPKRKPQL